jgi:ATP-dependent DNA ligase
LKSKVVVEVQYDHFTGGRFRHGTKFLRWRP